MNNQDVLPVAAVAVVPHGRDVVCPRRWQLACAATACLICRYKGSTFSLHSQACAIPCALAAEGNA